MGGGESQVGMSNLVFINDPTLSFKELGVTMQNSTVVFQGRIQFKSDQPLECLTLKYSKDDQQTTYNYWSCKTCGINWVCEWCMKGCHDGHDLLPHVTNHRPTWACCFCVKKNLCKISNSKNKQ